MNLKTLWSTLEEADAPIDEHAMMGAMKSASELNLPPDWFNWAAAGLIFGDNPISVDVYMRLFPYGLAQATEHDLASAAKQGYLIADGKGGYHLSEEAASILQQLNRTVDDSVAEVQPLSAEAMQRIVNYLARLADASFSAARPSAKWLCSYKRNNMNPGADASISRRFIYYYDQVAAYRDDVYVSLWQAHGVEGHTWNTLDMLNQNDALAFDALYEKLQAWGVPQDVHAQDVRELARRGWVDDDSGRIQITSAGRQVRADVEAQTERLFFVPWSCLNESELEELASLASQLLDGLKK
jgi:hypothetical protein